MTKHIHSEAIIAWANGSAIERRFKERDEPWVLTKNPKWGLDYEYRVAILPDSINWDHVDPKWKFMSRDATGSVCLFTDQPVIILEYRTWGTREYFQRIDGMFSSLVVGALPWKESLVRRPSE